MKTYQLNEQELRARERVVLALDLDNEEKILSYVDELSDLVGYVKVNAAFTMFGPDLVRKIQARGAKIFLDLKVHDIPNTVAWYGRAVTRLGVDILTIHTAGGMEMMREAVRSANETAAELGTKRPMLIGIALLTSMSQETLNRDMGVRGSVVDEVIRKGHMAAEAGLDGIVCSAAELPEVKPHLPAHLEYITPGVRPVGSSGDDHKRVVSHAQAIQAGASILVVGRSILGAVNRREAAYALLQEIATAAER